MTRILGIGGNWQGEAVKGLAFAGAFMLINKMYPAMALGVPKEFLFGSAFLTGVILAPILEEISFRGILLAVNPGNQQGMLKWAINAAAFALFHMVAYGQALQTAFIGAFVFGFIACMLAEHDGSLTTVITMHMGFNWWLMQGAGLIFIGR